MFCTNCGSKLVDGAKFCSECGARVVKPEEPVFRTNPDIKFEEPKVETSTIEAPVYDETPERPVRETVSFDWSNVVDEPQKRDLSDIKSPWTTTGGIDEKAIYAEITPSTEKSRTMSFIDILKAEKEEKEKAAADKAIEYTEVLHIDPDLTAFEEPPQLHYAPLYEDVDEPVITPFDIPEEEKAEPVFEDEPQFEEPEAEEAQVEEPQYEEPLFEEPQRMAEAAEEPELTVSRETIAQFDEYVKSFEKEAGIVSESEMEEPLFEEPVIEEPEIEEPETEAPVEEHVYEAPKFELPDFLKKITDFGARKEAEPVIEEPVVEELAFEEPEIEEPEEDEPVIEELAFEEPEFEEPFEPEITPDIDELFAGLTPASQMAAEEPAVEAEQEFEEESFEEPKYEEAEYEEPEDVMEDLYLDFEPAAHSGRTMRFDVSEYDDSDDEDEEAEEESEAEVEEGIDEEELFREMEETAPEVPGMTIAPPADKQEEIDALRKRLAELTGVDLYEVADLNAAMSLEELEEPEEDNGDELFDEPSDDMFEAEITPGDYDFYDGLKSADTDEKQEAEHAPEYEFTPEITPEIDEFFAALTPASASAEPVIDAAYGEIIGETAPEEEVVEEVVEEAAPEEEVVEEVVEEAAPEEETVEEVVFEEAVPAEEVVEETVEEAAPEEEAVEEVVFEEPAPEEEAVEEIVEEAAPEEETVEEVVFEEPAPTEEAVEDIYLQDFEPAAHTGRTMRFSINEYDAFDDEGEEPEEAEASVEEIVEEAAPVEEAVEEVVIEEPAPVEEVFEEAVPEEEPVVEVVEEAAPVEEAVEEAVIEEPASEEEPVIEIVEEAAPAEEAVEEIVEEAAPADESVEELFEEPVVTEEAVEEVVEEAAPVEKVVEEAVEEAAPAEETVEAAPAVKTTDALSLEELERDLFGDTLTEEVEAEETKKIDKFYTLYRKNEEFQRLLDEEYEKLKHGGGLTEEEKAAVDAVPKMADVEAAKAAAAAAPVAAAVGAVASEAIPVENKKAYRQVEDETIYMSKEELDAKLKAEAAAIAASKAPAEVPADKAAKKKEEKKAKKKVEVEYEDVESGSKFLTVLAVIIALILIVLLAVILILQIAPDSGIAAWIDSLIENITSKIGLIEPFNGQFLL